MSHVKAGGTAKNVHNNAGQRLGVKRFGGQKVKNGEVLVRQTGATKIAGPGTYMSRNFTIHAAKDGVVTFVKTKKTHFSGKSLPRVRVEVRQYLMEPAASYGWRVFVVLVRFVTGFGWRVFSEAYYQ